MATTSTDAHVANATLEASGNNRIVTFRAPVSKVWVRCTTGSATSLRVTVRCRRDLYFRGHGSEE